MFSQPATSLCWLILVCLLENPGASPVIVGATMASLSMKGVGQVCWVSLLIHITNLSFKEICLPWWEFLIELSTASMTEPQRWFGSIHRSRVDGGVSLAAIMSSCYLGEMIVGTHRFSTLARAEGAEETSQQRLTTAFTSIVNTDLLPGQVSVPRTALCTSLSSYKGKSYTATYGCRMVKVAHVSHRCRIIFESLNFCNRLLKESSESPSPSGHNQQLRRHAENGQSSDLLHFSWFNLLSTFRGTGIFEFTNSHQQFWKAIILNQFHGGREISFTIQSFCPQTAIQAK